MRYIIIGAGAIGGTIGGRLFQAGRDVVLVARGAHLEKLQASGLRLLTPDSDRTMAVPAVSGPDELGELRADDVLVLCVKSQDSMSVLSQWAGVPVEGGFQASAVIPVVCAQNAVENERVAQRLFQTVYGMCVWLPATHLEPGVVVSNTAPLSGILTLGRYPSGADDRLRRIGEDLDASNFAAPVVDDVMRWKYGKLITNLGNALDAIAAEDADPEGAEAILDGLRREAVAVLRTAGIPYVDRAERDAVQGDRMEFSQVAGAPRGGSSAWQSLARGTGSIETDYLNGEIALLGRIHGIATPVNSLLQGLGAKFAQERREPGSMSIGELRTLLAQQGS